MEEYTLEQIRVAETQRQQDNLLEKIEKYLNNVEGYYKITFVVSAYAESTTTEFDPTKDFVSLGFRLVNTDNVRIELKIYPTETEDFIDSNIKPCKFGITTSIADDESGIEPFDPYD